MLTHPIEDDCKSPSHGRALSRKVEVILEDGIYSTLWTTFGAIMDHSLKSNVDCLGHCIRPCSVGPQPSDDPTNGVDPAPHDQPTIEPYGRGEAQHPYWVGEHIWKSLLAHWNSPDYHNKCATAQSNSAYVHDKSRKTIEDFSVKLSHAILEMRSTPNATSQVNADDDDIIGHNAGLMSLVERRKDDYMGHDNLLPIIVLEEAY
ncbi:hypothetical protein LR48_Vigan09g004700 [Vigna angularis]|uniref:Uncharacterized protein n=1 Tax=Phaseolus angularis TaxID=3914 RepID=A0A0L9V8P9_PHAAN|nr:hypothetical protein LR48_Vigan09g004700 [Vigna angularis]